LGAADPPPLPHQPRKSALELVFGSFGAREWPGAVMLARRALTSIDPDLRTSAVAALARMEPVEGQKSDLLAALQDRWPEVVSEAASGLLRAKVDCQHELGPRYREVIQSYKDAVEQRWEAATGIGPAALPALFNAAESDVDDVRTGARAALRRLLAPFIPKLGVVAEPRP
jgi:hypothetical protein